MIWEASTVPKGSVSQGMVAGKVIHSSFPSTISVKKTGSCGSVGMAHMLYDSSCIVIHGDNLGALHGALHGDVQ